MQEGSLVEYIGGLTPADIRYLTEKKLPIPKKDTPYVVIELFDATGLKCPGGNEFHGFAALKLDLSNLVSYSADLFVELMPPGEIDMEELLKVPDLQPA